VVINPLPSQPLIPTFSYANVDLNGRVINVTLVGISSIPPALFCLQGLQGLSVFDSPSASIPPEISRLSSSLKSLTIANMPNSSNLPPELFTLKQLSLLSIINCGLETLPEDIGNLISLVQLNLDQNLLLNIPWGLGRLPSLTSLSLQNNRRLSSIDTLIGSKSLTTVRASNCSINQLPRNISNLSIIELDGNQLRSLDGLETISAHHSTSLSFNDNQITTISSASLKQIVTLDDFSLSGNLLTTLPDSLYLIKGLKTLYITDNKFDVKETEWIQGLFRLTNTTVVI
jgi:leucine-rich repeat protein SHOC2